MGLEIEAFKNELKNLWFYKKKINEFEEKIEVLEYQMRNVKGIDYSKKRMSSNSSEAEQTRLKQIEKLEILEKKKKFWEEKEKYICSILKLMTKDDMDLLIEIYANGKKYEDAAKEKNMSKSSLFLNINQAIAEAIKKGG